MRNERSDDKNKDKNLKTFKIEITYQKSRLEKNHGM